MKTKICTKCHKEKALSEFTKDKRRPSGFGSHCQICKDKYTISWRKRNLEKHRNIRRKSENKSVCKLTNSYIRKLVFQTNKIFKKRIEIPIFLIERKREEMKRWYFIKLVELKIREQENV